MRYFFNGLLITLGVLLFGLLGFAVYTYGCAPKNIADETISAVKQNKSYADIYDWYSDMYKNTDNYMYSYKEIILNENGTQISENSLTYHYSNMTTTSGVVGDRILIYDKTGTKKYLYEYEKYLDRYINRAFNIKNETFSQSFVDKNDYLKNCKNLYLVDGAIYNMSYYYNLSIDNNKKVTHSKVENGYIVKLNCDISTSELTGSIKMSLTLQNNMLTKVSLIVHDTKMNQYKNMEYKYGYDVNEISIDTSNYTKSNA